MLKNYEEDFCIEVINDTNSNDYVRDVYTELMEGFDAEERGKFIRKNLNHSDAEYIAELVSLTGEDVYEFLTAFDINWDSLLSLENSEDIWGSTSFSDEVEERIEELKEDEDEDEDW